MMPNKSKKSLNELKRQGRWNRSGSGNTRLRRHSIEQEKAWIQRTPRTSWAMPISLRGILGTSIPSSSPTKTHSSGSNTKPTYKPSTPSSTNHSSTGWSKTKQNVKSEGKEWQVYPNRRDESK